MDSTFNIVPLAAYRDNYIWLIVQPTTNHCIVVDPGDAMPVLAKLHAAKLSLQAIFITHHHLDHCGGVQNIIADFKVPVFAPLRETIVGADHLLGGGENITIANMVGNWQILAIPGHTKGHIAYYYQHEATAMLFCGDTLFASGCGRIFEGSARKLWDSLVMLRNLPDSTYVYCGHEYTLANLAFARKVEPDNMAILKRLHDTEAMRVQGIPSLPTTIALEKATNPFLRCDIATVKKATERHVGYELTTPRAVFAALRRWKDGFA